MDAQPEATGEPDKTDAKTEELRRVSRELLGSKYRLEVAVAVRNARRKKVYARALVDAVPGAGDNQVGECLKHFEQGGLLTRNPTAGGRDPVTFNVVGSAYWKLCAELMKEVRGR